MPNGDLNDATHRSHDWMASCAELLEGVTFNTTSRARVSVALQHLCIEHHQGAHVLVDNGVRGSAFALYRPQFEAYTRAHWYFYCATDAQLGDFVQGREPPRMSQLVGDLEQVMGRPGEVIRRVKDQTWREMCAFTHGGAIQVKARALRDEIRQSFTDAHTGQLIDAMACLSYLGALGIAAVADDEALANRLYSRHQAIYSGVYNRV